LRRDRSPRRVGDAKALQVDDLVALHDAQGQARQARRLQLLLYIAVDGREIGRDRARRSSARKRREGQRQQRENTTYEATHNSALHAELHGSPSF